MRCSYVRAVLASLVLLGACDDGESTDPPTGNIDYFCASWSAVWCPAYLECEPFEFPSAFRSMEECIEQSAADCLEPPAGFDRCEYASEEETDACVAYIEANHPDGCSNLFGRSADMAPCETICVD